LTPPHEVPYRVKGEANFYWEVHFVTDNMDLLYPPGIIRSKMGGYSKIFVDSADNKGQVLANMELQKCDNVVSEFDDDTISYGVGISIGKDTSVSLSLSVDTGNDEVWKDIDDSFGGNTMVSHFDSGPNGWRIYSGRKSYCLMQSVHSYSLVKVENAAELSACTVNGDVKATLARE